MKDNIIGERIKCERQNLKLSQTEFSKIMGVSKQCISGWETGRTTPDYNTLIKMAEIFNLDITYFFEKSILENNKKALNNNLEYMNLTQKEIQIIGKIRSLSQKKRTAIEIILDIDE